MLSKTARCYNMSQTEGEMGRNIKNLLEVKMYFDNRMFNPNYVNPDYYRQMQAHIERQRYEAEQNREIANAVKAVHDLCVAVRNMDPRHQEQEFYACLAEIARENNWVI